MYRIKYRYFDHVDIVKEELKVKEWLRTGTSWVQNKYKICRSLRE